jgi:hypothetical protein
VTELVYQPSAREAMLLTTTVEVPRAALPARATRENTR